MNRNICCFAGHGKISYGKDIQNQLSDKCRELIIDYRVNEFWTGNYGSFDKLSALVIRDLKKQYMDIELNLIIPYLTEKINQFREEYYKNYDNIVIAEIPAETPAKYRILKCNKYMIDNSKYLIAYVSSSCGGAAKTLEYAQKKSHIEIFNLYENKQIANL